MADQQALQNEQDIQSKGKTTAPRLTPDFIDKLIRSEQYHHFPGTLHVVCCLTLENTHTVIGASAPVSADNFDLEIGKKIARQNAVREIWGKAGYLLSEQLHRARLTDDCLRRCEAD